MTLETNNYHQQGIQAGNLGVIAYWLHDYNLVVQYHSDALEIAKELQDPRAE